MKCREKPKYFSNMPLGFSFLFNIMSFILYIIHLRYNFLSQKLMLCLISMGRNIGHQVVCKNTGIRARSLSRQDFLP